MRKVITFSKYQNQYNLISRNPTTDFSLREHANSNIQKISHTPPPPTKTENFQIKTLIVFHISAQNIDCGYLLEPPQRGGSNEYPQSMFLSKNKKK